MSSHVLHVGCASYSVRTCEMSLSFHLRLSNWVTQLAGGCLSGCLTH